MLKPKIYPKRSLIGQEGINLIEHVVLRMGFVWTPSNLDAGIDGIIELRDEITGEAKNHIIQVQSKATEQDFTSESSEGFVYYPDKRDIDYWLKGNTPVILVLSRPITNEAYWIPIKEYFRDWDAKKEVKVQFNKLRDKFTIEAKERLCSLAVSIDSGCYSPPAIINEALYPNLLEVKFVSEYIYSAPTKFRDERKLVGKFKKLNLPFNGVWMLKDKKIFTFNDLNTSPYSDICTVKKIEKIPTTNWIKNHDSVIKRHLVELCNKAIIRQAKNLALGYDYREETFYVKGYFDSNNTPISKKNSYNRLGRNAPIGIFDVYRHSTGELKYCRHLGFFGKFYFYDKNWYYEVNPTYYFTHDGRNKHKLNESLIKTRKTDDRNKDVVSKTLFWQEKLISLGKGHFDRDLFLEFKKVMPLELEVGINDEDWTSLDVSSSQDADNQLIFDF